MGKIPEYIREKVRKTAQNRCGYCLSPQEVMPIPLEMEHLIPIAKGGSDEETNLWLACRVCNNFKSDNTEATDPETGQLEPLFNPRTQNWFEHFEWSEDELHIRGITPIGRATVSLLHLSDYQFMIQARKLWKRAGWHPPKA